MELKNRQNFIKHVAEIISNNHNKDDESESYIFGISGKWGEGKTTFLKELAKELKKREFEDPIWINPWKFATDKISFLRYFIKSLSVYYQPNILKRIRNWINNKNFIEEFYYDESKSRIHPGWLLFVLLILIWIIIVYFYFPQEILYKFLKIKWILTLILIPVILAIVGKLISTQKNSKAISTLDRFEEKLNEVLQNIKDKRVVIFVDDLDRVTPGIAKDTLDNLRTFFDNKKLSFVVTGDHSVLERYLGIELLPNSSVAEQIDEGRRFLKKIFNVYWRLPLPLKIEIDIFINNEIGKRKEFRRIFNEGDLIIFKNYLNLYFEKNFRHIIRFLDTVLFSFKVVDNQISNNDNGKEKEYLQELKDNPLLVIRSLMIQDLCNPLFEEILKNSEILSNLEYAVQKQDNKNIDKILEKFKEKLSIAQLLFIKKFLFEKPRFHNQYGPAVKSIKTFLYFAADASFGDSRGPLPEDFKQYLKKGNSDDVKQSLLLSGGKKLNEALDAFYQLNDEATDLSEKKNIFLTLIKALIDIDADTLPQSKFLEGLQKYDFNYIKSQPVDEKVEFYYAYWQWLDNFKIKQTRSYLNKFNLTLEDINNLNFDNKFGIFASTIIFNRLVAYYDENKSDALHKMSDIFTKLDLKIVTSNFQDISKKLINDFTADINNSDLSEKRLQLLNKYSPTSLENLKENIFQSIQERNQDVWNWAKNNIDKLPFDMEDLQRQIVKALKSVTDFHFLLEIINFANNKILKQNGEFWKVILDQKKDILIENIGQIIDRQDLLSLSPDSVSAKRIFEDLYNKLKKVGQDEKIQYINFLNKNKWIWNQLDNMPKKRELKAMSRTKNQNIKNVLIAMIDSWG
ncbi:hypothetical protein B5M47_01650 [candidate division CPR3 bacterium 4484_211]|uniref:KAP NTPase domain-containing protein n=1 Tax=candidate division CPR3 bacterium 4484_211 TaxID=1968527 RepID=A0A1W9NYL5_UNCC3|nr:MAG: hypothetical protein B5M47_01650 [candidate division CPR3 bacterium 4484_211]